MTDDTDLEKKLKWFFLMTFLNCYEIDESQSHNHTYNLKLTDAFL